MIYNDHISVLLKPSIDVLNIKPNGVYVDCTFGRGGHSRLIYEQLNQDGLLICIDQDEQAIAYAQKIFADKPNVKICKTNFKNLKSTLENLGIQAVDGFIFDLGVSSPQLDDKSRGFSYTHDAYLDMRMDQKQLLTAYEIVNTSNPIVLNKIFKTYGEIAQPEKVVQAIIKYRTTKPIETTLELVAIIRDSVPKKMLYAKKHFARLYFQALRIAVNDEFQVLEIALHDAISLLAIQGTISCISFHSLEDKIVKKIFKQYLDQKVPNEIPLKETLAKYSLKINKQKPDIEEINENYRSRSSTLRALVRNF
ncbi:16S rRNA (cytosine(1402)-N(4))-methyltransferase RsmH [Ureaplasma miroungigenitalium]|uniref:Ribosomal RNA small subunit methyltransferase H n=1 Tax=Ureaplasma miroungigenitalium TaxID=1042321 RepID=A0ABT3BLV9_9BACT|nr:16S rRNA (cytosine(1402)-N(4))-methyltransferase RsmH [Ureaplasma miroungigenitalium]MCV3728246.1 16S rRNA (cytosine(1402)-N(4))-methyltransferase RsmH [Ureaplasma miroungigenitalium]MCV3734050.1 16S rRNA (cytosine(1402)-N(4))-methyltransferase RsmH [Ureaplasma miroungigenitalium]